VKMKKSELKQLIYETVQEAMEDILLDRNISESLTIPQHPPTDRMSLASKVLPTKDVSPYGAPKLKRDVVNGEEYTSGQGILEWFGKDRGQEVQSRTKTSSNQIDGLINRVLKK
jgi:hypothetical protein